MKALELEKSQIFSKLTKNAYHLFGVFIHEGEANFGHFWLFLYDTQNDRWLKYNDSLVTHVTEEQVFANTTGKTFNALSLIYVESEKMHAITSLMVRTPEYRNNPIYRNT